ncbi:MAG: Xaa-Pro peptidase family protein [Deltaproteobacteria bacterium]|nr:Xaa-Pro peptidase family protein [Deltaproteobacteria bacterium]
MGGVNAAPDYRGRLKGVGLKIEAKKLDALLVTDIKNIRYLSGFTGSSAYILFSKGKRWFLTDPRYATQAGEEVKGFNIKIYKKALEAITGLIAGLKAKSIGFESDNISFDTYRKIKKALPKARLKPAPGIIADLRKRKDPFEVRLIRASVAILDSGFEKALRILKPGVIERDAALEIEFSFKERGAEGLAFDSIIASGFRGALPHGKASAKKIKKGEFVVVDMGALKDGYNSDETRTFSIGRPSSEQRKVYQIVKDAQAKAIEAVRPGVKASEVDGAARGYIRKAGYGKFFGHGTGHVVGLDIHEPPSIGPLSKDALDEGMVITIEPGIYLPGSFGVRIEDTALVTKDGCEVLTRTSKELVSL